MREILGIIEYYTTVKYSDDSAPRAHGGLRWLRLDGHECCLNNEQHYYEKERSQFVSPAGQTRPTQV
jgi:hypothetical protein